MTETTTRDDHAYATPERTVWHYRTAHAWWGPYDEAYARGMAETLGGQRQFVELVREDHYAADFATTGRNWFPVRTVVERYVDEGNVWLADAVNQVAADQRASYPKLLDGEACLWARYGVELNQLDESPLGIAYATVLAADLADLEQVWGAPAFCGHCGGELTGAPGSAYPTHSNGNDCDPAVWAS